MHFARTARNLPFLSSASSASITMSRPCASDMKASLRSEYHFTGRPSRSDANITSSCSG